MRKKDLIKQSLVVFMLLTTSACASEEIVHESSKVQKEQTQRPDLQEAEQFIKSIEGKYLRPETVVYGSTVDHTNTYLKIKNLGNGKAYFRYWELFSGANSCSPQGVAEYKNGELLYTKQVTIYDEEMNRGNCIFIIRKDKYNIHMISPEENKDFCIAEYCGARGGLGNNKFFLKNKKPLTTEDIKDLMQSE